VVVLERLLETMTMMTAILDGLRRRRHHDVRMAVAVVAMGAMRVLDDFEQPVHVGFRIVVMTVLVLVIVPMRHLSMLGQRLWAPADQHQAHRASGRLNQQRPGLGDGLLQGTRLDVGGHQTVEEQL